MRSKRLHSLITLLALQCGVWLALAPVIPELHKALAHHRHVFCLEHERIEDQAAVDSGMGRWRRAGNDQPQARTVGASSPADVRSGSECLLSSFSGHLVFRGGSPVIQVSLAPTLLVQRLESFDSWRDDTLRLAPKTSPPSG